jgi:hypothetical protein
MNTFFDKDDFYCYLQQFYPNASSEQVRKIQCDYFQDVFGYNMTNAFIRSLVGYDNCCPNCIGCCEKELVKQVAMAVFQTTKKQQTEEFRITEQVKQMAIEMLGLNMRLGVK